MKFTTLIEQGTREYQEDSLFILENIKCNYLENYYLFSVIDGHYGNDINNYIINNFETLFNDYYNSILVKLEFKDIMNGFFEYLDKRISENCIDSIGCCIGFIFIHKYKKEHYIVIIGDVQCCIIYKNKQIFTTLHNFSSSKEKNRYQKFMDNLNNQKYKFIDYNNNLMFKINSLAINFSRSLGDMDLKKECNCLISTPSIIKFNDFDRLFLYTDGINSRILKYLNFPSNLTNIKVFLNKNFKSLDNYTIIQINK